MEDTTNYDRIATAIDYIRTHFKEQPDLNEVAEKVHLSPFHFQRLFTDWAGVSPKKFLQYLSIGYAKSMLQDKGATLFDTAFETGLSGTGRLHDLFIVTVSDMRRRRFFSALRNETPGAFLVAFVIRCRQNHGQYQ